MTPVPHSFVFSESTCGVCKGTNSSAKAILRAITHKSDALKADGEGDRFDAGRCRWTSGAILIRKHKYLGTELLYGLMVRTYAEQLRLVVVFR